MKKWEYLNFFFLFSLVFCSCWAVQNHYPLCYMGLQTWPFSIVWARVRHFACYFEGLLFCDKIMIFIVFIKKRVNSDINICNQFYQIYYVQLLNDILFVMTDSFHKSGFRKQAQILAILLEIVETNYVNFDINYANITYFMLFFISIQLNLINFFFFFFFFLFWDY